MDMGERIKYLRNLKGWTQEELGAKVGMQKSAIAKYEKGNVEILQEFVYGDNESMNGFLMKLN